MSRPETSERRGRHGAHPASRDWNRRPELESQLRERLGLEPEAGRLRVHELELAIRRLEEARFEDPLEALTQ